MSETKETLEERVRVMQREINQMLDAREPWNCISRAGLRELSLLLSDLMAERQSVDLDTLFPKEVMEKAEWWGFRNESGDVEELLDTPHSAVEYFLANEWEHGFFSDEPFEMTLVALSDEDVETDYGTMKKIIAETRVRLGLTVQKVEG